MSLNDFLAREILGHGAYLCMSRREDAEAASAGTRVAALAERLGLRNEFDAADTPSRGSIAFLRRQGATTADIPDEGVVHAEWVVHIGAREAGTITDFCDEASFHQVCGALRDVTRNPEWRFVREGPTWHGRCVAACEDLFR
jgi:hypothetical protein